MQDLIEQEKFELEVLEFLNSKRLLGNLVFGGGTMLRLCLELNRFSVDLDFWVVKKTDSGKLFKGLKSALAGAYKITDAANKFYTMLFEIKSASYQRSLKLEIRKERKKIKVEPSIAYSRYSNIQVMLKAVSPDSMMQAKAEALLERREIRDAFDIEFLLKKGIKLDIPLSQKQEMLKIISSFTKNDYSVKLGSLLAADERGYYLKTNFKILKFALQK